MNNQYRRPGLFGGFSIFPPVIKFLLIINAGVFLLEHFFLSGLRYGDTNLGVAFFRLFSLQPIFGTALKSALSGPFMPWQIFTYMFMHGDFTHLFFNMFALWMFGLELENLWGSKKFLIYYTICGLGAALANLFIAPFFSTVGPTVGASGSVYGILLAFGYLFPNRQIYIYFLIPLKAKYLVILYMALEVFAVASQSETGIAHVAHLGGAVVGLIYLLITGRNRMTFFNSNKLSYTNSSYSQKSQYGQPDPQPQQKIYDAEFKDLKASDYKNEIDLKQQAIQDKIDNILDKLSKSGYQSLTDEEKRVLFEESKKLR
ncbi:MAG: rhomboid family intramembrane serine protease [Ignavibacteriae bacterium]|nr:rhomboid family intramembrane serine protease [Ignavibacteriota bacterium]